MPNFVNLKYVSTRGNEYQFQSTPLVKTKAANFHAYQWNPNLFNYQFGAAILKWGKEPISYEAELYVYGSFPSRRAWLDAFHMDCDLDLLHNIPGRLYWGDMYIECFIASSSTQPGEAETYTINEVEIFCPYPSWIHDFVITDTSGEYGELPEVEGDWLPSDFELELTPHKTAGQGGEYIIDNSFSAVVCNGIADLDPIAGPNFSLNYTYYPGSETLKNIIVNSRRKTINLGYMVPDVYDIYKEMSIFSGIDVSRDNPFVKLDLSTEKKCIDISTNPIANFVSLTIFLERSEPTWIS